MRDQIKLCFRSRYKTVNIVIFHKKSYSFRIFSLSSQPQPSTHSSCIFIKIKPSINCKNEGVSLEILISILIFTPPSPHSFFLYINILFKKKIKMKPGAVATIQYILLLWKSRAWPSAPIHLTIIVKKKTYFVNNKMI